MPGHPSRLTTLLRRVRWLVPAVALGLAALSAGLGQLGYSTIFAEPEHEISFIVDGDLPYGITQETVEAAAAGRALSYEPFTVLVVERELTWDEHEHGDIPQDADVMISVGYDPADPDLSLPDARRAAVAKLAADDDWRVQYDVVTDIRETFLNNLTQGHGPGAVVGAALTAASEAFDGSPRSPVLWGAIAALPLLIAMLMMMAWLRFLARERTSKRVFSRARLQLARVVLELDLLETHFRIADAELERVRGRAGRKVAAEVRKDIRADWSTIRSDSLRLAHQEQLLTRELLDPQAPVHETKEPRPPMSLEDFVAASDALRRRADALTATSSLRVGHAAGGTVLGQVALPTTMAVEEILRHREGLSLRDLKQLEQGRKTLIALLEEAESDFGAESGPDVVVRHANLMERWRNAEKQLSEALDRIDRVLLRRLGTGSQRAEMDSEADRRERERARVATDGRADSLSELRRSLGIDRSGAPAPSWHAERVLLRIEKIESRGRDEISRRKAPLRAGLRDTVSPRFSDTVLVLVPIVAACAAGWVAAATMEGSNTSYGRTLTGDQPLAALHVLGDIALIPDYAVPPSDQEKPSNAETLTLDYIREHMETTVRFSDDRALLPERLEVIVALLPLGDYVDSRPHESYENRIEIDYADLLDAYPRIKKDAAAAFPDAIDPASGDVREGYAILPLWLGDDGSYGAGLPLTGELSSGVDSKLGAYYFSGTEPLMDNGPDAEYAMPIGATVAWNLSELGREMEYNNQRAVNVPPSTMFWTVAIAAWTGLQTVALAGFWLAQTLRRGAGTREARRQLREMREKLNRLALGLDLSRLDAVAVLGAIDEHGGKVAEGDQRLYETVLLNAWREMQELEELPRRMQRGAEWSARVERMRAVIDSLEERETDIAERALRLIRSSY